MLNNDSAQQHVCHTTHKSMYVCPICSSDSFIRLYAESNYDNSVLDSFAFASRKIPEYLHHKLVECTDCHVLFCVDIPDQQELHELYKDADYDSANEAQNASYTYMKYLKKLQGGKNRALDIGTGEGSFLKMLLADGWKDVVGVEPSKAPIESADEKIKPLIINNIFNADDFNKKSFDLVTVFQTIEHIHDSPKLVSDIKELLLPTGALYIVCHDYKAVINKVLGKKSPIYGIEHLQLFTKNSICKLLKNAGFSDVKSFTIKNSYPLSYWVKLFPLNKKFKLFILKLLKATKIGKIKIGLNVGNIGVIAKV